MDVEYRVREMEGGERVCMYKFQGRVDITNMQVRIPGLLARKGHKAAAICITPSLTLVIIFGGGCTTPGVFSTILANTTVLEFGELHICMPA